ncbi:MAG: GH3 auxin-responsive promoter family protein [Deltaproteobacteria bacterium]|nr:GH3 auxin-responsive promoter family protein [Deltaproteobacteria bacterium]
MSDPANSLARDLALSTFRKVTHTAYAASLLTPRRAFAKKIQAPEKHSAEKLKDILSRNENTEFGRDHRFERIDSVAEFQNKVPIRKYEELAPYIHRAAEGRPGVLTSEDVVAFERTSGSSSFSKLIPYTRSFLNELEMATSAWLGDVIVRHPALLGKQSYWSLSPLVRRGEPVTKGGIPIGMESDLEYFNPVMRAMLSALMVKPRLGHIASGHSASVEQESSSELTLDGKMTAWRLETAAALLEARELGFISIWSPTFLFPIFETIGAHWDEVIPLVTSRRRRIELDAIRDLHDPKENPQSFYARVWPGLSTVSCWSDGPSADTALKLENFLPPNAEIEGKGLLATEGVVTIPFSGSPDPVIAIGSHFLEFIDLERPQGRPRLPHELKTGGLYSPLMTTSSGLYRYHLRDVLFCTGRNAETPTLRFRGRLDKTSDLCGEKLDSAQVERALEIASNTVGFRPDFFLLAPEFDGPLRYRAFIEAAGKNQDLRPRHEIAKFLEAFEKALKQNPHYAYALDLKQLLPLEATVIEHGVETWEKHMLMQGHRLGDLKLSRLDSKYNWREVFQPVSRRDL